ncbi:MAG: bifunctional nuclease family protein [Eggerthellaceae bacterium]|nr:bifunctional nuclease family protein [Eggerthellaceae bacterium]
MSKPTMVPVKIQTLIVAQAPHPSILVLVPSEDTPQHDDSRVVPIWMGTSEATQIGLAINQTKFKRPLTHDLMIDMISQLDASIIGVDIVRVEQQTFYAELSLHQQGRTIVVDARPSDAIGLAIREQAPIRISSDVLRQASFPYITRSKEEVNKELSDFHSFVTTLSPDDFLPPSDI